MASRSVHANLSVTQLERRVCPVVTNTLDYDRPFNIADPFTFPIPGSLRYELAAAMQNYEASGGTLVDTITFNTNPALGHDFRQPGSTIHLLYGSLEINHPVKIDAPKTASPAFNYDFVTIDWDNYSASKNSGSAYGSDWSVAQIGVAEKLASGLPDYGRTVSLGGLKFTGGNGRYAAGIEANGYFTLSIDQCDISGNVNVRPATAGEEPSGSTLGGGIAAFGVVLGPKQVYGPNVIINNSSIYNNRTDNNDDKQYPGIDWGGGMYFGEGSSLTIVDSAVYDNKADNGGGAIYFTGGQFFELASEFNPLPVFTTFLKIQKCDVTTNSITSALDKGSGGAIEIAGATAGMISDSTFLDNQAKEYGGAIRLTGFGNNKIQWHPGTPYQTLVGQVHVVACTFEGNAAAVGLSTGTVVVERGAGGGLYMEGVANEVFVVQATFSKNSLQYGKGGGIAYNGSTLDYDHKTIFALDYDLRTISVVADQSMPPPGPPPHAGETLLEIFNSTIAHNSAGGGKDENDVLRGARGGGIALLVDTPGSASGQIFVTSTIVAKNTVPAIGFGPDLWASDGTGTGGTVIPGHGYNPAAPLAFDLGYNLVGIGDNGGLSLVTNTIAPGSLAMPLDPRLYPLAFNGNYVKTHAIGYTSPAYEKGDNPLLLLHDERGEDRIRAKLTDIGAYEATGFAVEFPILTLVSNGTGGTTTVYTDYPNQRSMITYLDVFMDPLAAGETLHAFFLPTTTPPPSNTLR